MFGTIELAADSADAVWKATMEVWLEYDSAKIRRAYETLRLVHDEIVKAKGGNGFKVPHFRYSDRERPCQ